MTSSDGCEVFVVRKGWSIIWADVDCFHRHPNKNRTSNPTEIVTLDFYEFLFLGGVPVLSY